MRNYKMSVVFGLITLALVVCTLVCVANNDYDTFCVTCFPLTLSLTMFLFVYKTERDIHKSMSALKELWLKEKGQQPFFLSLSAMLDRFKKLVAVAEEMVTEYNNAGHNVDGMNVHVECNQGFIRLGTMREYAVYYPDENQYMPEYALDYDTYYFTWVDNTWVKDVPKCLEAPVHVEEEDWDELPFQRENYPSGQFILSRWV